MTSQAISISDLFHEINSSVFSSLPPGSWYIVTASALVATSDPMDLGKLYTYLIDQPEHRGASQRRDLNRRLREFILKQWITIGAPRCALALGALIQAEQPGDADPTFTKANAALDEANRERGTNLLRRLYGDEKAATMYKNMGADMEWVSKEVIYGVFWSDTSILSAVETELINFTGITCQGLSSSQSGSSPAFLHKPLVNHLSALRSLGVSFEEAKAVTACAKMVANWSGKDTNSWAQVSELIPDWK